MARELHLDHMAAYPERHSQEFEEMCNSLREEKMAKIRKIKKERRKKKERKKRHGGERLLSLMLVDKTLTLSIEETAPMVNNSQTCEGKRMRSTTTHPIER